MDTHEDLTTIFTREAAFITVRFAFLHINSFLKSDLLCTLRKHAYSTILKISPPKTEIFQIKNSDIFHISAQNIDCGYSLEPPRQGGSNEYKQYLAEIRKIMYTPVNQFYYIKVGFKGVKIT